MLELASNRSPHEGFERGDTGFVEWMKIHYPRHVRKVIDERMKTTIITFVQVKQTIGIGLMCTNVSNNQQPSLHQISKMINRVYQSSLVSQSATHRHKIERTPTNILKVNGDWSPVNKCGNSLIFYIRKLIHFSYENWDKVEYQFLSVHQYLVLLVIAYTPNTLAAISCRHLFSLVQIQEILAWAHDSRQPRTNPMGRDGARDFLG